MAPDRTPHCTDLCNEPSGGPPVLAVTQDPTVCTSVLPGFSVTSPELPSASHLRACCCNDRDGAGPRECLGFLGTLQPAVENVLIDKEVPGCTPHWQGDWAGPQSTPNTCHDSLSHSCYSRKRCRMTTVLSSSIFLSPFGFPCL